MMMKSLSCYLGVIAWLLASLATSLAFSPSSQTQSSKTRSLTSSTSALFASSASPSSDDHFDMKELEQRINEEYSAALLPLGRTFGGTSKMLRKPETVYVVVFQPGTMNQGAHTIEYPQGSGNNVVLAFESFEASLKFAESLGEQKFVDPVPLQFGMGELESYFGRLGVSVQVVPEGVEVKPPTKNVKRFGHDPSLRDTKKHLDYLFEMTDEDLEEIGLLETVYAYDDSGAWE